MTAEGHCNIVWGGDFKDTLRFQTSNFSFSFDATFRFADYSWKKNFPRFPKNVGDFQNFVGDFPKKVHRFLRNDGLFLVVSA